mmetsp:Transcript_140285/g.391089  ORF Transcript_140285/g.391089 Transcript_140285/m.391089 type:complete len:230 (+) Transcript_140285:1241-1930(+)
MTLPASRVAICSRVRFRVTTLSPGVPLGRSPPPRRVSDKPAAVSATSAGATCGGAASGAASGSPASEDAVGGTERPTATNSAAATTASTATSAALANRQDCSPQVLLSAPPSTSVGTGAARAQVPRWPRCSPVDPVGRRVSAPRASGIVGASSPQSGSGPGSPTGGIGDGGSASQTNDSPAFGPPLPRPQGTRRPKPNRCRHKSKVPTENPSTIGMYSTSNCMMVKGSG